MKLILKKLFIVYAVVIFFAAVAIQFTGRWISWGPAPSIRYDSINGYIRPVDGFEFGYPVGIFYAPLEIKINTGDTPIPYPLSLRIFSTGAYANPGGRYLSHGLFMWEQKKWDHTCCGSYYKIVSAFGIININNMHIPDEIDPSFTSRVPGVIANIFYVILVLVCLLYLYYSGMVRRHAVYWIPFFILAGYWLVSRFIMCVIDLTRDPTRDFIYFFDIHNWFVELLRFINIAGMCMIYFCVLEWLYLGAKYLFQRLFFRKSRVHGLETSSR